MKATGGNTVEIAAFIYAHMQKRPHLHLGARAYDKPYDRTMAFVSACGLEVVYGTPMPLYFPTEDLIGMPHWPMFVINHPWRPTRKYCSVLLHELVHATAHNKRLGRPLGLEIGDTVSCREELVAEMGACFLGWDLAISKRPTLSNAAYLQAWVSALPNARVELEMALGRANQATAFLLSLARRRGRFGC